MEKYHIKLSATYEKIIKARNYSEAWEAAERVTRPGWIIREAEVTRKEVDNAKIHD